MADPQKPTRTTGISSQGQAISLDRIPSEPAAFPIAGKITVTSQYADYVPDSEIDYTDLNAVNRELVSLRIRLHRIRIELKTAEREAVKTRYAYEAKKKRTLISLSGGSAPEREAMAELMCEEEYTAMLVANNVAKEIQSHSRDLRTELETLREISNNLRRIIDLT